MKTMSKKIASIVLTLCLCFSLVGTALAASSTGDEPTYGSITISNAVAGEEYTIYQIFDFTYTDDGTEDTDATSHSYKIVEDWENFLSVEIDSSLLKEDETATWADLIKLQGNGYLKTDSPILDLDAYLESDDSVFADGVTSDQIVAAMAQAMLSYAAANNIVGITIYYTVTVDEQGNIIATAYGPEDSVSITGVEYDEDTNSYTGDLKIEGLDLGYYLVGTSLGSLCMLDNTEPDAVINEKNTVPTLDKWVMDFGKDSDDEEQREDEADTVDTLRYEIVIHDAANTTSLCLHDVMDPELILQHVDPDDETSGYVTLYLVDTDADPVTYTEITSGYTVVVPGATHDDGTVCAFEITFNDEFTASLKDTDDILIIYNVSIDASSDEFEDDYEEWDNTAHLTYGLSQTSTPVETETFSYGFEIWKYTGDIETLWVASQTPAGDGNETYLRYTSNDVSYYALVTGDGDGTEANPYVVTGWTTDLDTAWYFEDSGETQYYFTGMIYGDESCHLYTYIQRPDGGDEITEDLSLVDAENADPATALAGAEFELSYTYTVTDEATGVETEVTIYGQFEYDENADCYYLTGWTEDESAATQLKTPASGLLRLEGLEEGTYTLTETAAPDGYNKLDSAMTVVISVEGESYTDFTVTVDGNVAASHVIDVLNNTGAELPGTGGIGTTIFYIIGGILVVGAVVVLVTRRRVNRSEG